MDSNSIRECVRSFMAAQVIEDLVRYLKPLLACTCENSSVALEIADSLVTLWNKWGDNFMKSSDLQILAIQVAKTHILSAQRAGTLSMYITFSSEVFKSLGRLTATFENAEFDLEHAGAIVSLQKLQIETFGLASAIFSVLEGYPYLLERSFLCGFKDCICESLNFLKAVCLQKQNFESTGGDYQKVMSEASGSVVNVLLAFGRKMHHQLVETGEGSVLCQGTTTEHFCAVSSCIHMLVELGKAAATGGRSLVGILNVSWKGVTSLLQMVSGYEEIVSMLDIEGIIHALLSCALESLQHAAECWLLSTANKKSFTSSSEAEFRKLCIPIKFFLINAVRVASIYPHQAAKISKMIVCCLTKVSAFRFALSNEKSKVAAQVLAEIVEPISFVLLCSLLSSEDLNSNAKVQLLEYLMEEDDDEILNLNIYLDTTDKRTSWKGRVLKLGRLALFLNVLQFPSNFGREMTSQMFKMLDWLLDTVTDNTVYAAMLELHLQSTIHPDSSSNLTWKLLYTITLSALKVFTVSLASTEAWNEVEAFLFRNALHPHVLCRELILDLWCFIARHAQVDLLRKHIFDLFSVLKDLSSDINAIRLCWPLKSIARLICSIVTTDTEALASELYVLAFNGNTFLCPSSAVAAKALITENFALMVLPKDHQRSLISAIMKPIIENLSDLVENFSSLRFVSSKIPSNIEAMCCFSEILTHCSGEFEFQHNDLQKLVEGFCCILQANMEMTLKSSRPYNGILISELLRIMSRILQKLSSEDVNNMLLVLHNFVKREPWVRNDDTNEIRSVLPEFLACLSATSIPEDESNSVSQAIWELYHHVLREQHWALVHLGLASFGYFAAHTSCSELWRFVPPDAALAFSTDDCSEPNEETFMSALRVFLEKEEALLSLVLSDDEQALLHTEGTMLRKTVQILSDADSQGLVHEDLMDTESKPLETIEHVSNSQIEETLHMMHAGIALLKEKLPQWLKDFGYSSSDQLQICEQLSILADIVGHLNMLHPLRTAASDGSM